MRNLNCEEFAERGVGAPPRQEIGLVWWERTFDVRVCMCGARVNRQCLQTSEL